jgi:lipopolysaccharide/colanic/teichoic acid biosynthesis glycosyltransferase
MVANQDTSTSRYGRFCDILIARSVIAFLMPLMAAVALAIKADGSGPVLRRRTRICRSGRWIQIFEFRTAARHDREPTRMHRFLGRTRIDTLPQAINVLRGDLTFIGPDRPCFLT